MNTDLNTKDQAPSSRETPSSKSESAASIPFDYWCLELLWYLVFGVWCFPYPCSSVFIRG
ncbi:MAG: hypothetical protein C5B50_22805 [Verrucomicrobia bacterium]|nr:MAG: hypothetical protein C5B50_22805 [Verrucomicrobiota bacterium]